LATAQQRHCSSGHGVLIARSGLGRIRYRQAAGCTADRLP
jgi:hypothetical protein